MQCPSCQSSETLKGRILADGSEEGSAERFIPSGLRLLTLKKSVRFTGSQPFQACTACGLVWNRVEPVELNDLVDRSAGENLKRSLLRVRKNRQDQV